MTWRAAALLLLSQGMVFGENIFVSTCNERLQRFFDESVRANLKDVERRKDGRCIRSSSVV